MNTKFTGLEGQSMQFLTQVENIKATQTAAQANLISSIEFEIDKTSKAVAEMKTASNQTLEDIKKEFQNQEAKTSKLHENLETAFSGLETRISELGEKAKEKYDELKGQVEVEVVKIHDEAQKSKDKSVTMEGDLQKIVDGCRDLYSKCEVTFSEMKKEKALGNEGNSQGEGRGGVDKRRNYLPEKNLVPPVLKDDVAKWRMWRNESIDYFDVKNPGLGAFLRHMSMYDGDEDLEGIRREAFNYNTTHGTMIDGDASVAIWRVLKKTTEGIPLNIVLNVNDENGIFAWVKLAKHFQASLDSMQGSALIEFASMAQPATSTADTKRQLTEYQSKIKFCEEITGKEIDPVHKKSVLLSMLDPETRRAVVQFQGKDEKELMKQVLLYINGIHQPTKKTNSGNGATPMVLGSMAGKGNEEDPKQEDWPENPDDPDADYWAGWNDGDGYGWEAQQQEHLNAMKGKGGKKGKGKCFGCGSPEHKIQDCPKGKSGGGKSWKGSWQGSSKGSPKGYPKGYQSGKWGQTGTKGAGKRGPVDGCYNCGGDHYASVCPNGPAGGAGAAGRAPNGPPQFRSLSSLVEVKEENKENKVEGKEMKLWTQDSKGLWNKDSKEAPSSRISKVVEKSRSQMKLKNSFEALESDESLDQIEIPEHPGAPRKSDRKATLKVEVDEDKDKVINNKVIINAKNVPKIRLCGTVPERTCQGSCCGETEKVSSLADSRNQIKVKRRRQAFDFKHANSLLESLRESCYQPVGSRMMKHRFQELRKQGSQDG